MRIARPRRGEPIRLVTGEDGRPFLGPDGQPRYRAVVDVGTTAKGTRRQMTTTHRSLSDARDWLARTRSQVKAGQFVTPERTTFNALADDWLASKASVRPVTVLGYQTVLKPVRERLGTRRVQSITRADLDALMAELARSGPKGRPLSRRSLAYTLTTTRAVLRHGIPGLITVDPSARVEVPREAARRSPVTPWEPAELLTFRQAADAHEWAGVWRVALSGLRRSEVLGLRWDCVDLEAGTVRVERGRVRLDASHTTTDDPKTSASRRVVPVEALHPGSAALLRTLKARQAADRLAAGRAYADSGYVLVDALGEPVAPGRFTAEFARLCREAGVPVVRLHWLRHTLAGIMHRSGVEAADAASLLGHSTHVHLTHYVEPSRAGQARAAEAFAAALAAAR